VTRSPARPVIAPERRRQLRQQRRQERLRQLWRISLFSVAAAGLGFGLLREGWVLRNPDQIEVLGSSQVTREQVIREAQLRLPQPLLGLKPQELTQRLSTSLPVEQVQVNRLMLPPRLRISLVEREAVAQAQRRGSRGIERGYVDRLGNWMTSRQQRGSGTARTPQVMVMGWQERLRTPLADVLAQQQQLGSTLQQVRFETNGSLWLRTAALGDVHLGPPDDRLARRLEVLRHLSTHLPKQIKNLKIQSIDLSDPEQPELGLPGKSRISIATLQQANAAANAPSTANRKPPNRTSAAAASAANSSID
jgi:cell division protein FtsQ